MDLVYALLSIFLTVERNELEVESVSEKIDVIKYNS